jgi:hypothetical protein
MDEGRFVRKRGSIMVLGRLWRSIAVGAVWLGVAGCGSAHAAVFLLTNGGQVEGRLLNPDQQPRSDYQIEMAGGGRLTLRAQQVKQVLTVSDDLRWYQQWQPKVPNSVDGHWTMAEQCRMRNLNAQREHHLNQILQLDPDHKEARYGLGFSRVKDQWVKTDEWMQNQGYVRYRGAWRTPQDVALEQAIEQFDKSEKDWLRKIKNWRTWILKARGREAQAREAIRAIDDPAAAAGLIEIVENEKDPPELRMLCIEVLGKLRTPRATRVFVQRAMQDPDANIRDACLDELKQFGTAQAVPMFLALLKSSDNKKVNRAAACLNALKNPEATLSLVNALVTEHKFMLQAGGTPGQMNLGFGSGPGGSGGGTFGVSGNPKIVKQDLRNESVLNALRALWPGVNFGFDTEAWKAWFAERQAPSAQNLRRDD